MCVFYVLTLISSRPLYGRAYRSLVKHICSKMCLWDCLHCIFNKNTCELRKYIFRLIFLSGFIQQLLHMPFLFGLAPLEGTNPIVNQFPFLGGNQGFWNGNFFCFFFFVEYDRGY